MRLLSLLILTMSIQSLLPRDVLLRQFAICHNNADLPLSFRTDAGPVKTRNKETIMNGTNSRLLSKYVSGVKDWSRKKSVDGSIYDCNLTVWKVIKHSLDNIILDQDYYLDDELGSDSIAASGITSTRLGYWVPKNESQLIREKYDQQLSIYHRFMSLAKYLETTRDVFNSSNHTCIEKWKREGSMGLFNPPTPFSKLRPMSYCQIGKIVILKIKTSKKHQEIKYANFVMTNTHYSRIIDYFKSASFLSIYLPDINGISVKIKDYVKLLNYQASIGLESPNGVGSVFKTARQFLYLKGDKSMIMGTSASNLFASGLTGIKAKYGEKVADKLEELTGDRKSALNLANMFRIVPHPDAEMDEVFDSISGFQDPNKVEEKYYSRFEGNVRKAVYQSLVSQKFDVRSRSANPENEVITPFVEKINSTSTPISDIMRHGYVYWSNIEFEEVRGLFDHSNQDIPVSNKSSAPNSKITTKEIRSIGSDMKLSEYKLIKDKLRALNDVASVISGKDELDFKNARSRFKNVIKLHEEFEEKYLDRGMSIDEINHEDLAEFVTGSKEASYTVLTEPKLGEVHKEVTRLFYMAEQALKIMTQVTERAIKKVISKSAGVSIVKTHRARRKEIEEMLDAYTGIGFTEDDESGLCVVYISFDMSEFSKRFPQKLVRAIGKVLGELTGEDWMSRIDVFFRASVVYHNTRGFTGAKAGAKGGFEGFLNFIWTLAMKVVMDIATESTGVEGVLAVYSDDGLLRLYVNGDNEEVSQKVMRIKRVFEQYGLIFHLDKTAVSREIMEYLGLYGERGMLIPTWIKEVMSIGKRKQTPGLETVYDKVRLWDSQCNAVVKANGPPYPCALIKTILAMQTMRRLNRTAPSRVLASLTVIPSSAGGFRVSSISEASLLSSIEGFSEFSADLELLSHDNPIIGNGIAYTIYQNLKCEKDAEKSILTGSFLQTTLVDTSGLNTALRLVEDAGISSDLSSNPITKEIMDKVLLNLRSSKNISQRILKELVNEIPDMIKFNKSVAIIKSTAALRFVERKKIMMAQRSDTRKCKESIKWWVNQMDSYEGGAGRIDATLFMEKISDKLYPSYDFAQFKESPRVALRESDEDSHVIVSFETTDSGKITEQNYREPKFKGLGAQLSPEVSAESSFNTEQRMLERFVSTAARLVSTNPSLLNLYYILASAFSLPCPSLPSMTVVASHKSSKNFGMSNVHMILPVPYHALVNSRMGHSMYQLLRGDDRKDRTTLVEAARMAGYLRSSIIIDRRFTNPTLVKSYLYELRRIGQNTANPSFDAMVGPDPSLITTKATKAFTSTMVEETAQAKMLESVITTNGLITCINDSPIVKAILLSKTTKWLISCIKSTSIISAIPFSIPDPWKRDIFIEASIAAAFSESAPNTKRALQLSMSDFLLLTSRVPSHETLKKTIYRQHLNIAMNTRQTAFDDFSLTLTRVMSSVSEMDLDEKLQNELSSLKLFDDIVLLNFISFLKRKAVQGGSPQPTVVINSNTFADTTMSREVKNTIKGMIDSTLCSYINQVSVNKTKYKTNDQVINYLTILKQMLRPSGHRNKPFNTHMLMIQIIKFELFINEMLLLGVRSVTISDLLNYRVNILVCRRVCELNSVIGGRSSMTSGEDMRTELFDKGILKGMLSRANYILKNLSTYSETPYITTDITEDNILSDPTLCQSIFDYTLEVYNNTLKSAVENIEVRHSREAEMVTKLVNLTPVEEVSLIMANTRTDSLVASEFDIRRYSDNETYQDILLNLFLAHHARWCTEGYTSDIEFNRMFRARGIFGKAEIEIGNETPSAFRVVETESEYYLHSSMYESKEKAVHNYLYVNRLAGGMAVIGKDEERYILLSILPKGTKKINTEAVSEPEYLDEFCDSPNIYALEIASRNLAKISREMGLRPKIQEELGEMGSVVLRQAYQRLVGASSTVENEDHFLVAMAEVARGAWSQEMGLRILAMFSAWMSTGEKVTIPNYVEAVKRVQNLYYRGENEVSVSLSISACWEWLRLMKITAGPDIDTGQVERIIDKVGRINLFGGVPTAVFNLVPKSLVSMKQFRGNVDNEWFILTAQSFLYDLPERLKGRRMELESFEDQDWINDEDW